MFNKQNFCHIASNNRNDVKAGVFVYKTTDDLQTVSASGYFNEKIVDINLHDLIIHEWHDPTDRTNVEYNLLCVTERTLDNVGTSLIMSDWEKGAEEIIADLDNKYVKKTGDTMTGALRFGNYGFISQMFGSDTGTGVQIGYDDGSAIPLVGIANITTKGIAPSNPNTNHTLGRQGYLWKSVYTKGINNGYDIAVPVTSTPETLALKSEVDLAANSGDQLTNKGVWYAKMYAATVAPSAEDGTNYADFSQTDGQGNPIIVLYERQNGAWVQTDTITPPADYNGYVTVTSKIWDIVEQSGQQGGKVLWSHNTKTFTPYPQIISFEDINITGDSTVAIPATPSNTQIVNKQYVDTLVAAMQGFDLFDFKWRDSITSNPAWALSDGNWINKADAPTAYNELYDDVVAFVNWAVIHTPGVYTKQRNPNIGDPVYSDSDLTQQIGTVDAYANDSITYNGITVPFLDMYSFNGSSIETVAGISVRVRVGKSGRKYVLIRSSTKDPTAESDVAAIYNATGVAWYYIVDAENERFKLPRTTFGFVGLRDNVGDYVAPELPNITFTAAGIVRSGTGALTTGSNTGSYCGPASSNNINEKNLSFSAANSSSVYKNDATVQQPATQMYLYFYIGV